MDGTKEETSQLRDAAQADRTILCADGDAVLVVSNSDKSVEEEVLISSTVLSLASDYFKILLTSDFKEGRETQSGFCPRIPLKGDDPQAMLILLSILHFRNLADYETVKPWTLADISVLCDKYDCTKALWPWISLWLGNYKGERVEYLGWFMSAAYIFGDSDALRRISIMAICHFNTDIKSLWSAEPVAALLPEKLLVAVEKRSKELLSELHMVLQSGERSLRRYTRGYQMTGRVCIRCDMSPYMGGRCNQCGTAELRDLYCTTESRIAEYFETLSQNGLWPSVKPFESLSPQCIVGQFSSAARICQHNCSAVNTCPLREQLERVSKDAEELLLGVKGITLEELN